MRSFFSLLLVSFCFQQASYAETVEFSVDELATETVLPRFEKTRVVLNRNIETAGHFELGGGLGLALNEPFYNPMQFHLSGTYHIDDLHGINLWGAFFSDGLSQYGEQLKRGEGLSMGESFDASKAPVPSMMALANYQFNAYYGKISLSKQAVANLSLFGTAGLGVLQTGGITNFGANFGFGQNFYLSQNLALRVDLRFLIYHGPDATSQRLRVTDRPAEDAFAKDWFVKTFANLGLVVLL